MKKNNKLVRLLLISSIVILGISFIFLSSFDSSSSNTAVPETTDTPILQESYLGIPTEDYIVEHHTVGKNEFLSSILQRYNIGMTTVHQIIEKSKPVFDVKRISAGQPYTIFKDKEQKAAYFIYHTNAVDYITYDLRDSVRVYADQKETEKRIETVAGVIDGSLYVTLQERNASPELAVQLAEIYGWAINFYRINKGDWFKIIYERTYVEGEPVSNGRILSAIFSHLGKEYQAYYFQGHDQEKGGYYDEEGKSLRRSFLKAPLKYSRISSQFTMRRFHPVQRVWKAHLGTDFAAPHGTPIVATGDGVVIESAYGSGNGNYVKIKHDDVYTTQYLHMSKRAAKKGQRVRQGEVIGYVGSTGLATGPHVCYRFWKNGQQVDALKQQFPPSVPIAEEYKVAFSRLLNTQSQQLAKLNTNAPAKEVNFYETQILSLNDVFSQPSSVQDSVSYIHHSML